MVILTIPKAFKWFSCKSLGSSKSKSPSPRPTPENPRTRSPSPPPTLKNPKNENFHQVFRFFDSNDDGKISADELTAYFLSVGESMSHEEAEKVITEFDADGDNLLGFEDFVQLVEREKCESVEDGDDLKKAFEMFVVDKGLGCITPRGLQVVLNRLGDQKSYEECEAMILAFDLDGNGMIDFHEFHQMMR